MDSTIWKKSYSTVVGVEMHWNTDHMNKNQNDMILIKIFKFKNKSNFDIFAEICKWWTIVVYADEHIISASLLLLTKAQWITEWKPSECKFNF